MGLEVNNVSLSPAGDGYAPERSSNSEAPVSIMTEQNPRKKKITRSNALDEALKLLNNIQSSGNSRVTKSQKPQDVWKSSSVSNLPKADETNTLSDEEAKYYGELYKPENIKDGCSKIGRGDGIVSYIGKVITSDGDQYVRTDVKVNADGTTVVCPNCVRADNLGSCLNLNDENYHPTDYYIYDAQGNLTCWKSCLGNKVIDYVVK